MNPEQDKDKENQKTIGHKGLVPIILATQEAKIRRIEVQSQPGQISSRDPISKILNTKRSGGVPQGPEFKLQYCQKKKEEEEKKKKTIYMKAYCNQMLRTGEEGILKAAKKEWKLHADEQR
jgi:hypothetical protein